MITMVLGGLWHGAAWSYAVWGAFHGSALAIERFLSDNIKVKTNSIIEVLKGVVVFLFVTLAWLLFKLPGISDVIGYFESVKDNLYLPDNLSVQSNIIIYSSPVILYHAVYLSRQLAFHNLVRKLDYCFYSVMLFLILTNSGSSGSFIYFQF